MLKQDWSNSILFQEEIILGGICYDLELQDPLHELVRFQEKLKLADFLIDSSTAILYDRYSPYYFTCSFNGDFCLRLNAEDLAAAAIYSAIRIHNDSLEGFWRNFPSSKKDLFDRFENQFLELCEDSDAMCAEH